MTTKSRRSKTSTVISPVTSKRIQNSWVLLVNKPLLDNSNFSFVTLPHPADGRPAKYCLDDKHNKIYEVVTFNEPYRSWFIGETVKSDGSILMTTPINPLFLVLPRLKEHCSNKAVPLEDLLSEKGYDKIVDFVCNLEAIGDLKGPAELKAYKYNEEKALIWLEARVRKLTQVLKEKNIHVTSGAVSATFVASSINSNSVNEEFYLKYAHGIISEYLQSELIEQLEKRFNFKPDLIESVGSKRKSEHADNNDPNKKIKRNSNSNEDLENMQNNVSSSFSDVKKQKPLSAKEKARQKAASGTKTISSFFTKK